jgi:hypothetical protein
MMKSEQYDIEELPATQDGKFGGFKIKPKYSITEIRSRLHPIQIHLKYDMNKELDHTKSNNGIER